MMSTEQKATIRALRAKLGIAAHPSRDGEAAGDAGPLAGMLNTAWRAGGTVEFCGPDSTTFMLAAWLAARRKGPIVLIDPAGKPCVEALAALGLDPARLLVVQPGEGRLALWAAEQSLRCEGVAATLCWVGSRLETVTARRLKLSAEAGGGMGLILRSAAREPPFMDARLHVHPLRSESTETLRPRWEVKPAYIRGTREEKPCIVEVTTDARLVSVAPQLARPAAPRFGISG